MPAPFTPAQLAARLKAKTQKTSSLATPATDEETAFATEAVATGYFIESLVVIPAEAVPGFPGGTWLELIQFVFAQIDATPITYRRAAGQGQSNLNGLARIIDRSGAQLGPFPKLLIHNDDADAEQPLELLVNEAGLNGLADYPDEQPSVFPYTRISDGATILQGLAPYHDGFGAERALAEACQAEDGTLTYYFKKNVEHPSSTNGATMAVLTQQFGDYTAEFNRQTANIEAAGQEGLAVSHFLLNQGEAESGNVGSFISQRNTFLQLHKDLFANQQLKTLQVITRGGNNQYADVAAAQYAWAAQAANVVCYDDPAMSYLTDHVHTAADSMDAQGLAFHRFLRDETPTITGFTPDSAAAGDSMTITGTNFAAGGVLKIGGVTAVHTVVNSTTLTATVPVGASTPYLTYTLLNVVSIVDGFTAEVSNPSAFVNASLASKDTELIPENSINYKAATVAANTWRMGQQQGVIASGPGGMLCRADGTAGLVALNSGAGRRDVNVLDIGCYPDPGHVTTLVGGSFNRVAVSGLTADSAFYVGRISNGHLVVLHLPDGVTIDEGATPLADAGLYTGPLYGQIGVLASDATYRCNHPQQNGFA